MLEQEKRWDLIQQGREEDYHGVAVHPRHLSLYEQMVLKHHRLYQPNVSAPNVDSTSAGMQQMNGNVRMESMQVRLMPF